MTEHVGVSEVKYPWKKKNRSVEREKKDAKRPTRLPSRCHEIVFLTSQAKNAVAQRQLP